MAQEAAPIHALITGPLEEIGLLVEDVKPVAAGTRRTLTITVDLADDTSTEPVSLDLIGEATRVVSEVLDPEPLFGDKPYDLEVTSPGAERPLTQPRHFRRVVGRTVEIRRAGMKAKDGKVRGELTAVSDTGITVRSAKPEATVDLAFDAIDHAEVVVSFR
ncbi:ribosome maturation factor RimP [Brevibacterium litoralis]|uniref:ribosome maturation factor RimP n=1 Tax=Brevibacterium litoralis TaxID=3138935 RepID=UPI0032EFF668